METTHYKILDCTFFFLLLSAIDYSECGRCKQLLTQMKFLVLILSDVHDWTFIAVLNYGIFN